MTYNFLRILNQSSRIQTCTNIISPFLAMGTRFLSNTTIPPLERVGFIGLGNMGFHMANNLLKAGYNLVVYDRNYAAMEKFADRGVSTAITPLKVAEASDAVITMLPSSPQVMDVYLGSEGFLGKGNISRPWLLVDASTVDPQTSRRIAKRVSDCVLTANTYNWGAPVMLDAPVSGGVLGAEARTLTFMVGGPHHAFLAAQPLLNAMGKQSIYCGKSGNGAAAKICNNLAMAISMAGISEALALGQHLGISASILTKIFNSSSARCWSSDSYNPVPGVMAEVPSSKNYDGGFSCNLMAKDLGLALVAAKEVGIDSPLTTQLHEISPLGLKGKIVQPLGQCTRFCAVKVKETKIFRVYFNINIQVILKIQSMKVLLKRMEITLFKMLPSLE
ncbi:probable 3-hydroxyisobutyrate dehydrogenase, mitochondrial isoform X1 [Cryptomeria japonica]|uniref:probable 3-hydroxyisobutyrate dehydrogenase, mitochondrial isoform X1 n=2 Tax=Cryptomeria japonica TaxID=3369 RepID=UPI0025ACBF63|nr:probable 3-hydroxyisobutyrate dehydrogenase, mitochondrial isoform X1 [Cryptomeria japonica]